jgi:hypothetical protein
MHKNREVLTFDFNRDILAVSNARVLDDMFSPVGKGSQVKEQLFLRWMDARCIPNSREGMERIKSVYHIGDPKELMLAGYGLGLSDHYWIKKPGETADWNGINYFDHRYSENMGRLAFDDEFSRLEEDYDSPEPALNGSYRKRWHYSKEAKKSYLIKGGQGIGQEPYNEEFCARLLDVFQFDHVPYELKKSGNEVVSICPNIIDKTTELVSAGNIMQKNEIENNYGAYVKICKERGLKGIETDMYKMLAFDLLIANTDRHWHNFGIVRNADTGEWIKPIPLFDNGSSLWHERSEIDGREASHSSFNHGYNETAVRFVKNKDIISGKMLNMVVDIFDACFTGFDGSRKRLLRGGLIRHIDRYKEVMRSLARFH